MDISDKEHLVIMEFSNLLATPTEDYNKGMILMVPEGTILISYNRNKYGYSLCG